MDHEAWRDIYGNRKKGHQEFEKNPIRAQASPNGVRSIIQAAEQDHARMRKPLAAAFSLVPLVAQEPSIQNYVDLLVDKLKAQVVTHRPIVDLRDYFNRTTFDLMISQSLIM